MVISAHYTYSFIINPSNSFWVRKRAFYPRAEAVPKFPCIFVHLKPPFIYLIGLIIFSTFCVLLSQIVPWSQCKRKLLDIISINLTFFIKFHCFCPVKDGFPNFEPFGITFANHNILEILQAFHYIYKS